MSVIQHVHKRSAISDLEMIPNAFFTTFIVCFTNYFIDSQFTHTLCAIQSFIQLLVSNINLKLTFTSKCLM